jgi:hypothetical protein
MRHKTGAGICREVGEHLWEPPLAEPGDLQLCLRCDMRAPPPRVRIARLSAATVTILAVGMISIVMLVIMMAVTS